jgi:hypothetical protein
MQREEIELIKKIAREIAKEEIAEALKDFKPPAVKEKAKAAGTDTKTK